MKLSDRKEHMPSFIPSWMPLIVPISVMLVVDFVRLRPGVNVSSRQMNELE
jgi:hypothetical protein